MMWTVRVELYALDDQPTRMFETADQLRDLLRAHKSPDLGVGSDQGDGTTEGPAVGLLFAVTAPTVGEAADRALQLAQTAGAGHGVGPELSQMRLWALRADTPREGESIEYPRRFPLRVTVHARRQDR